MKNFVLFVLALSFTQILFAQQKVGINTNNPGYALDVFDAANQGFFANFVSNNATDAIIQIQANNTATAGSNAAYIGVGLYRIGNGKGYLIVDPSNNLVLSTFNNGSPGIAITPTGNVGIGTSNAGFPLNFANNLGDKISLYSNTGNNYGFGVQNLLMQMHTDVAGADIGFGYGSSTSFTENMRIKGNGYVGIGTSNPAARLQLIQRGLYSRTEGQGNALEIWDTTGTDHILYMGADATNQLSFIQSVAAGGFRDLYLQPRGGNLFIGKDQPSSLAVRGNIIVDNGGANNGTTGYWLQFGGSSGEAIGSKRNAGGNQNGIDFYTASTRKMGIANNGNVDVVNNLTVANGMGLVHNNSATQIKRLVSTALNATITLAPGDTLGFGTNRFFYPETFSAPPIITIAGIFSYLKDINGVILGPTSAEAIWVFYDINNTSCRGVLINPTKYTLSIAANWNVLIEGPQ